MGVSKKWYIHITLPSNPGKNNECGGCTIYSMIDAPNCCCVEAFLNQISDGFPSDFQGPWQWRWTLYIWGFPKIGVPLNHPFKVGISHFKPYILGTPILGNPHGKKHIVEDSPTIGGFRYLFQRGMMIPVSEPFFQPVIHELIFAYQVDITGNI